MARFRHLEESASGLEGAVKRGVWRLLRRLAPDLALQLSLRHRIRETVIPAALETKDVSTDVPSDRVGHDGIGLRSSGQVARLQTWAQYRELFRALSEDPGINLHGPDSGLVRNDWYQSPDAEIYAAMIADFRPSVIVEVGSGFSTLIAKRTIDHLQLDCRIMVVDPEPRREVEGIADDLLRLEVEALQIDGLPVTEKLLFFIDSTHVIRARGDIPHLYLRLLPSLPKGTMVHVHDVFIPYDYPFSFQGRLYTEQYLVHALLAYSRRYRVVFATHLMARAHGELLQELIHHQVGRDPEHFGSSLWFSII